MSQNTINVLQGITLLLNSLAIIVIAKALP